MVLIEHYGSRRKELVTVIWRAYDSSMPRKALLRDSRPPLWWWCASMENLRAICFLARWRLQRVRTNARRQGRGAAFREVKLALNKEIKCRKRACLAYAINPTRVRRVTLTEWLAKTKGAKKSLMYSSRIMPRVHSPNEEPIEITKS